MGWDWDTSGETAWMTAVNLENGLIPARHQEAAVKGFYCGGPSWRRAWQQHNGDESTVKDETFLARFKTPD